MDKKWVLVTGAGKGIGRSLCFHLSQVGYTVLATVQESAQCDHFKGTPNIVSFVLDITKSEDIESLSKYLTFHQIELFGLVNNAGVSFWGPVLGVHDQAFLKVFEVNVLGTRNIIKACFPFLSLKKAHIINVASTASMAMIPFMSPYSLSKKALEGLVLTLKRELMILPQYREIKISVIHPGSIKTSIWEDAKKVHFPKDSFLHDQAIINGFMTIDQEYAYASDPILVAKKVTSILKSSRPAFRHFVGRSSLLMRFLELLPRKFQDVFFQLMNDYNKKFKRISFDYEGKHYEN